MAKTYKLFDCIDNIFRVSIQQIIEDKGPIVAATRELRYNRKTQKITEGVVKGTITNYDGRKTNFEGQDDYKEKISLERARWHYFRSFREYGFTSKEWK